MRSIRSVFAMIPVVLSLSACGGGGGGGGDDPPPQGPNAFAVGGTVDGLTSAGLVLANSDGQTVAVAATDTRFTFPTNLPRAASYTVTVITQPNTQDCAVTRGTGTVNAAVTDIVVACGPMAPLELVSSTPAAGAAEAPRSAPVTLTFSRPVTVSAVPVIELANAPGTGSVAVSRAFSSRNITLTPEIKLLPLAQYLIQVPATLQGTRGETLPGPISRSFTTADAEWQDADRISEVIASTDASPGMTSAVIDRDGNALVAWRASASDPGVYVRRYTAATRSWGEPRLIFGEVGEASVPLLAMDEAGNATVAWNHRNAAQTPYRVVWAARFIKASGQWESAHVVSHADQSNAFDPALAVGVAGKFTLAWVRQEVAGAGLKRSIWVAELAPGANAMWSTPRRVDDVNAWTAGLVNGSLTLSASANVRVVAWAAPPDTSSSYSVIWAKHLDDTANGLGSPARIISNRNGDPETRPQVAITSGGNVHVIWQQNQPPTSPDRDFSNIWMADLIGDTWRTPRQVAGSGTAVVKAIEPRIAT